MTEAVFDTDILTDALRNVRPAQSELMRYSQRYISRLSWIEVMIQSMPDDSARTESYLDHFRIIEVSEDVARQAATLRSQRRSLKALDAIVLASAQTTGRVLVTRNTADFPAEMPGVRVPYTVKDL
ncbi:type II toxin-antitoxin system VapC family toxin [Tsuneonella mangrovi]|uniref:type II toxin-antitoxin system VapC family toxin n=1 Tax=Tsuneonella mangrovi TaxID=1982042 RepID=UPI000BA1FAB5|nr:type II toxin-antitoxin system VapC family toxin [Tsuneonella mangrovi]